MEAQKKIVIMTVRQFVDSEPALSLGGVRWDLHNRESNGLLESGAVVFRGKHIRIIPDQYLSWLTRRREG